MSRWRYPAIAAAVIVLAAVGVVAVKSVRGEADATSLSAQARVTASSSQDDAALGRVVTNGPGQPGWTSADDQIDGSWIQLDWTQPHTLRSLEITRNPLDSAGVRAGFVTFGDGSQQEITLSDYSASTVVGFQPRTVSNVRFTVTDADPDATAALLSQFQASDQASDADVSTSSTSDGDTAPVARLSASDGSSSALRSLVGPASASGSGSGDADADRGWSVADPQNAWVQLRWDQPRELTTVSIAGAGSGATLASGTLRFSDGSTVPVGAVTSDADRPTVVSFMPRSTTSVRLTLDAVDGSGPLRLTSLSTLQRGAPPVRPSGAEATAFDAHPVPCRRPISRPSASVGIVVTCPTTGAHVGTRPQISTAVASGYTKVVAKVWPNNDAASLPKPVTAAADQAGRALLTLDLSDLDPGPLTVHLTARGSGRPDVSTNFQLFRSGAAATPPPSGPASGRSLVYDQEFDAPISISQTGEGADYSAAKPTDTGMEGFGDAAFADPASGLGTVRVVDGHYLQLQVEPDPDGSGSSVGGMLASARPGGSGYASQYGYFEARMLVPANPGTWPAFWMLPATNLVAPQSFVDEVDAVEHYGHDPRGTCSTTHQYPATAGAGGQDCGHRWPTDREALAWHTFGVSIEPDAIRYYIDGQQIFQTAQVKGGEDPQFFMLDLALGGGWPVRLGSTQGRAALYVDYVRVYQ